MSLYKQLWLAIIVLLTLAFGISCIVSSLSTRAYLEQQLSMKNADNANALALSLTQQNVDLVTLELILAAQFDTGFYELIQMTDPEGNLSIVREDTQLMDDAPAWFVKLFPIEVASGVASVQKGWQQLGTLTLRSHSRYAYKELWESSRRMAAAFVAIMIVAGLLGSYLLMLVLRPLKEVVSQARAIDERRFITIPEPATLEFRQVVNSMNSLSRRITTMLQEEAERLDQLRRESHVDEVTGLLNREQFVLVMRGILDRDDASANGVVGLVRVGDLAQLNQRYGHASIDAMLADLGEALNQLASTENGWSAFRLNGSDFALIAPLATDPMALAQQMQLQLTLQGMLDNRDMRKEITLPAAAYEFRHGDVFGELMTSLDAALLAAASKGQSDLFVAQRDDQQAMPVREQLTHWRQVCESGFREQRFSLAAYPVVDFAGKLLHLESPIRLQWQDVSLSAGRFMPWIHRLELAGELDQHVVDLALRQIEDKGTPTCINLSPAAIADPAFVRWLNEKLSMHADAASQLWMEVQETTAYRNINNFRGLCSQTKHHGARVGIKHMAHQMSNIGKLHDMGLDYVKIDPSFIRDVDSNPANQIMLRTLCTLVHSIGLTAIAGGVRNEAERAALRDLGVDGLTGPAVKTIQDQNVDGGD